MKLTMKNIGVIRDAEMELDGITVLAGFNGTGKSTTSKALYGAMASYANLSRRIAEERKYSVGNIIVRNLLFSFSPVEITVQFDIRQSEFCAELANKSRPIPERYEEWVELFPYQLNKDSAQTKKVFPNFLEQLRAAVNRPNAEYAQYLVGREMQFVFDRQINTINSPFPGEIALTAGQETRRMQIAGNKVTECSGQELNASPPIYLDTRHVLDGVNEFKRQASYNAELYDLLRKAPAEPTFEEYKSRERLQDTIVSVIHGKLTVSTFGEFMFQDERFREPVSLRNIASGNKTFAVLQRLIEQGALRPNGVLIIDEPENNQHPAWQLKLAETLVLIQRELGVRLFLNTHSTYFLRAIEVYSKQYGLAERCHYYKTEAVDDAENLFYVRNVDGNTKLIYRDFYLPFEEL